MYTKLLRGDERSLLVLRRLPRQKLPASSEEKKGPGKEKREDLRQRRRRDPAGSSGSTLGRTVSSEPASDQIHE